MIIISSLLCFYFDFDLISSGAVKARSSLKSVGNLMKGASKERVRGLEIRRSQYYSLLEF